MELLRVGKRLEHQGVLFVDLWPQVLGFCGRGWFEPEPVGALDFAESGEECSEFSDDAGPRVHESQENSDDYLALPSLSN